MSAAPVVLRWGLYQLPAREMTDTALLGDLLDMLTRINEACLRSGCAPMWPDARVAWRPNLIDRLDLAWAPDVAREGLASCGPIAAYAAASLRADGTDPGARAFIHYTRPGHDFRAMHALVRLSDGRTYDPSRERGMT